MRVLSDPVTVTEEYRFIIPLHVYVRRRDGALKLKSGNLLCVARLNFRVKCNTNFERFRSLRMLSAFYVQTFFMELSLFIVNYTSKRQAILLRLN